MERVVSLNLSRFLFPSNTTFVSWEWAYTHDAPPTTVKTLFHLVHPGHCHIYWRPITKKRIQRNLGELIGLNWGTQPHPEIKIESINVEPSNLSWPRMSMWVNIWLNQHWTNLKLLSSSDPHPETLLRHSFWHTIWKYIWHIYFDNSWHSIWHSFRHILWHSIGHSNLFWHSSWHILTFFLAFYLASILTFCLASSQAFILASFLAYLTFCLAFYLIYLQRFFVVRVRLGSLWSWVCCSGPAGNTAI